MSEGQLIVGVDGGAAALSAVSWAARECAGRGTTLVLLHALGHRGGAEPSDLEQVLADAEAQARAAAVEAGRGGVHVVRRPERGAPAEALVAASTAAQLIVLGNNGAVDLAGSMLGTVGHRVAAHSRCPVVIVPAVAPAATGAGPVVVGLTPGRTGRAGREALRFALEYANRHAWPIVEVGVEDKGDLLTALGAFAENAALFVLGCRHSDERWSARLGPVPSALLGRCPVPIALVGAVDADA